MTTLINSTAWKTHFFIKFSLANYKIYACINKLYLISEWKRMPCLSCPTTWSAKLIIQIIMTLGFFLVELIVGITQNSVALLADSFHMLSDVMALIQGGPGLMYAQMPRCLEDQMPRSPYINPGPPCSWLSGCTIPKKEKFQR